MERAFIEGGHEVELLGAQHDVVEHGMGPFDEWPPITAMTLLWPSAGKPFHVLVPGSAIVDRAASGEADKIAHAARVGYFAAEFAMGNLLPLDGANRLLSLRPSFSAAPPTLWTSTSSKLPSEIISLCPTRRSAW